MKDHQEFWEMKNRLEAKRQLESGLATSEYDFQSLLVTEVIERIWGHVPFRNLFEGLPHTTMDIIIGPEPPTECLLGLKDHALNALKYSQDAKRVDKAEIAQRALNQINLVIERSSRKWMKLNQPVPLMGLEQIRKTVIQTVLT